MTGMIASKHTRIDTNAEWCRKSVSRPGRAFYFRERASSSCGSTREHRGAIKHRHGYSRNPVRRRIDEPTRTSNALHRCGNAGDRIDRVMCNRATHYDSRSHASRSAIKSSCARATCAITRYRPSWPAPVLRSGKSTLRRNGDRCPEHSHR